MRLPMPLGIKGSVNLPRTFEDLINCFSNENGQIIGRRGINNLSSLLATARGAFRWQDSIYIVSGTDLLKVTDVTTGATTTIDTILGVENIRFAAGFTEAVIVSQGEKLYTIDTADSVTDITGNTNFVVCDDVAFINGRWVYIPTSGDPAFFSDVNAAGTVQVDSFFDAEELPDKNRAVANLRNTLYIFGANSVELYRDIGTDPVPFSRIQGARIDNGYLGGLMEYSDTLVYIGKEKDLSASIYAIESGFAKRLSNERVDERLESYTEAQLAEAVASRLKMRGYDIATWTLRDDAWGFYKGEFFRLQSIIDEDESPWSGGFIVSLDQKFYSAFDQSFGVFAEVNNDNGNRINRVIQTSFNDPEGRWFTLSRIELGVSQGLNANVGSVAVFVSRDNKDFPIVMYRNLGDFAEYDKRLIWQPPGGFGAFQGFVGLKIFTTEDIVFDVDSLIVDFHQ